VNKEQNLTKEKQEVAYNSNNLRH